MDLVLRSSRNRLVGLFRAGKSCSFSNESRLTPQTQSLIDGILQQGNRSSLSRAITLVESTLPAHQKQAELLLDQVLSEAAKQIQQPQEPTPTTFRMGIAGPPGAGKSTFIETLGLYLTSIGHRVAVLAIDPSSTRTGGSILGDKTRMTYLSNDPNSFVRPSPTRGTLGGVAQHTNEIVLLCEAAKYDIVLVESVGLGQSEIIIDDTVDMVMLLVPPAGGDELQGSKKGIMEIADLIVVNKADGKLKSTAKHTAVEYMHSMQLMRPKHPDWKPSVLMCSALENKGIKKIWETALGYREIMTNNNQLLDKRNKQSTKWMWNQLEDELLLLVKNDSTLQSTSTSFKKDLLRGAICPRSAARKMLNIFLRNQR